VAIAALYGTPWQYRLLFAKLPDLSDVDITELKLMILAVLERHGMGPEWRRCMRGAQLGGMLDLCGSARRAMAAGHRSGQGEVLPGLLLITSKIARRLATGEERG
jgi:hypothetical protein